MRIKFLCAGGALSALLAGCAADLPTAGVPAATAATAVSSPTPAPTEAVFTPPYGEAGALPGEEGAYYYIEESHALIDYRGDIVLQGGQYGVVCDPFTGKALAVTENRTVDTGGARNPVDPEYLNPFESPRIFVEGGITEERVFTTAGVQIADWAPRTYYAGPVGNLIYTDSDWHTYDQGERNPAVCGGLDPATGTETENDLAAFYALDANTAGYRTAGGEYGLCDTDGGNRTPLPEGDNFIGGFPDANGVYEVGSAYYGMGECSIEHIRLVNRDLTTFSTDGTGYYMRGDDGTMYYNDDYGDAPSCAYNADGALMYTAPEGSSIRYCSSKAILLKTEDSAQLITPEGTEIAPVQQDCWAISNGNGAQVIFSNLDWDKKGARCLLRVDGSEVTVPENGPHDANTVLPDGSLLLLGAVSDVNLDNPQYPGALVTPENQIKTLGSYAGLSLLYDSQKIATIQAQAGYFYGWARYGNQAIYDIYSPDGTLLLQNMGYTQLVGTHFITRKGFTAGVMDKNGKWLYKTSLFANGDGA